MKVEDLNDLKKLFNYLKSEIVRGNSVDVSISKPELPTPSQIACFNAIARDLSLQSVERGCGIKISPVDFKMLLFSQFFGDYYELGKDGSLLVKPASGKFGMNRRQMGQILFQIVSHYNEHYGFDLIIPSPKTGLKAA